MIRYALRCENAHRFDSWFGSSEDFDRLSGGGMLACAVCGSSAIEKDLMAPGVAAPGAGAAAVRPRLARPSRRWPSSAAASRPSPRTSAATSPPRRGASTRARAGAPDHRRGAAGRGAGAARGRHPGRPAALGRAQDQLMPPAGQIVILNGAPRAGKSSIVAALQAGFPEPWMNLGVDVFSGCIIPPRLRPGIGLRPGGELPELEALLPVLYAALYESVAAHSRLGLNVAVDVGHHDAYARAARHPARLRPAAGRAAGLFVGVRCPIATDHGAPPRRAGRALRRGRGGRAGAGPGAGLGARGARRRGSTTWSSTPRRCRPRPARRPSRGSSTPAFRGRPRSSGSRRRRPRPDGPAVPPRLPAPAGRPKRAGFGRSPRRQRPCPVW